MRIRALYYILAISYCKYLFFQLGPVVVIMEVPRTLKLKSTQPMGGPPAKRPRLLIEAEVTGGQRRMLKLKNTDPPGGPPPKRRRLQEEELDCYQVHPVFAIDWCVRGQVFDEDLLVIHIDEDTVTYLEDILRS
jgi:hypothetical protein